MPFCHVCTDALYVTKKETERNTYNVYCNQCGNYEITFSMDSLLEFRKLPYTASSWIHTENLNSTVPLLKESDLDWLGTIPEKRIKYKYELMLNFLSKNDEYTVSEESSELISESWCKDFAELNNVLLYKAIESNHLKIVNEDDIETTYVLTYEGIEFIESLGLNNNSNKIFMAFHFTNDMKEQFESTIVRAVSDSTKGKLEAVRVSSSTTDHDTKIDDELIAMIKSSKAVIADFTGNRTAVYYEAGYAMGLGIPVIWTCRDTDVDSLSFDTRQYPHIIWKDEDDLYTQVVNRLKAKII